MKADFGAKATWPLPPASVFKCKAAKPWINPELFEIRISSSEAGITRIRATIDEDDEEDTFLQYERNICPIFEESSISYSEPVQIYGLPLPNTKIRIIEYSDNPEKGIDSGSLQYNKKHMESKTNAKTANRKGFSLETENERLETDLNNNGSQKNTEKVKKRKWSFRSKDPGHGWLLCY